MGKPAQYMTHADRAYRRERILEQVRAGIDRDEIAASFKVSRCWVNQTARAAGIPVKRGRGPRRVWRDCPPHLIADYDFLIRRKRIPAAMAREILEAA